MIQSDCAVLSMLQPYTVEGVEFSVSPSGGGAGILAPVTTVEAATRFLGVWCGERPGALDPAVTETIRTMSIRFVRCDFIRSRWQTFTIYGDSSRSERDDALSSLPICFRSMRITSDEPEETTYFDGRSMPSPMFRAEVIAVAARVLLPAAAIDRIVGLWSDLESFGWIQNLAVKADRPCVKIDVATSRLMAVLKVMARRGLPVGRVDAAMKALGGSIGYVGVKVHANGDESWRLYSRPLRSVDVAGTIAAIS